MNERGGDGGRCFAVQGVTNMTEYVVATGIRELGDLLTEEEKGVKYSLYCVQMNKEELVEQAEGKVKEN